MELSIFLTDHSGISGWSGLAAAVAVITAGAKEKAPALRDRGQWLGTMDIQIIRRSDWLRDAHAYSGLNSLSVIDSAAMCV
jgi:hypothetical protein